MNKPITGQVIVRKKENAPTKDGRILYAVFGIIAVPEDVDLRSEHQYPLVCYQPYTNWGFLSLELDTVEGKDLSERTLGHTPDGILCQPLWRV